MCTQTYMHVCTDMSARIPCHLKSLEQRTWAGDEVILGGREPVVREEECVAQSAIAGNRCPIYHIFERRERESARERRVKREHASMKA